MKRKYCIIFQNNITIEEISVKSIEKLHKKKKRSAKIEPVTIMTEESKEDDKDKTAESIFPYLDTTTNIF